MFSLMISSSGIRSTYPTREKRGRFAGEYKYGSDVGGCGEGGWYRRERVTFEPARAFLYVEAMEIARRIGVEGEVESGQVA